MNTLTRLSVTAMLMASMGMASAQEAPAQETEKQFKVSLPKISGLINGRYGYDSSTDENTFDIRRVRLAVSGDMGNKIDYKFQAEYGGGSTKSAGTAKLLDAFVRFKIAKEFNIQVGEFKVEYSQETLDGPASWVTIENPAAVSKLNGYSDESGMKANSRDIGIRFYGGFGHKEGFDLVSYKIGVYNGNGLNIKDNNKFKDVAGLIYFNPLKELTLSFGQYIGRYSTVSDDITTTVTRNRTSAGLTFKRDNIFLRSEYLRGKTGDKHHQGAYATFAYSFPHGIQPVLSYSFYQKDTDLTTNLQHDYQVGLNWKANKWIRTQLAYTFTDYTNSSKKSKNLVEVQLIGTF